MRYKISLSYDGTCYSGWQIQPNALTIQQILQDTLEKALGKPTHATGAGRTDAGVHALEQVAHFDIPFSIDPKKLQRALNGMLPYDIRILNILPVSDTFHARYSSTGKTYQYNLSTATAHDPFTRHFSLHLHRPIDPELLRKAANCFVGTHDFTTFANKASTGAAARGAIRTIYHFTVTPSTFGYTLEVFGGGFLYKMVRNMVGTILQIASGKLPIDVISYLLAIKDRRKAPMAAGARGLFLKKVHYDLAPDLNADRL